MWQIKKIFGRWESDFNDHTLDFEILSQNKNDKSNNHRDVSVLITETLKMSKNDLVPPIISFFQRKSNTHNLKTFQNFVTERKTIIYFDLETQSYRSAQFWALLLDQIRQVSSLELLKEMPCIGFVIPVKTDCVKCTC